MGVKKYTCDKKVFSGEWLIPLTNKGYRVTLIEVNGEESIKGVKNRFHDGSAGWFVSNGARKVGAACYETPAGTEAMVNFSSLFIWFCGNLKLASEVESLLLASGVEPKRLEETEGKCEDYSGQRKSNDG